MRGLVVVGLTLLAAAPAWAQSHGVTIQNATSETIRLIQISPGAGGGDNRLRSTLPPGAVGRIGYSTGCIATVRLGFESGRTEDHPNVDTCADPRVIAGSDAVAGPNVSTSAMPSAPSMPSAGASPKPGNKAVTPVASTLPAKAPPPVVPPWTGKSITKRFGGMD